MLLAWVWYEIKNTPQTAFKNFQIIVLFFGRIACAVGWWVGWWVGGTKLQLIQTQIRGALQLCDLSFKGSYIAFMLKPLLSACWGFYKNRTFLGLGNLPRCQTTFTLEFTGIQSGSWVPTSSTVPPRGQFAGRGEGSCKSWLSRISFHSKSGIFDDFFLSSQILLSLESKTGHLLREVKQLKITLCKFVLNIFACSHLPWIVFLILPNASY